MNAQWGGRWLLGSQIQLGAHHTNFHLLPLGTPSTHPRALVRSSLSAPRYCSSSWAAWASWSHQPVQRAVPALPGRTHKHQVCSEPSAGACCTKPESTSQSVRAISPLLTITANIKTFIRPLEPRSPATSVLWQIQDALVCLYGLKAKRSRDYQESGNMAIRVSLTLFIKAHIPSMLHFFQ